MISNEKIRTEHLHRPAFVYVRQSSLTQVRHPTQSHRTTRRSTDRAVVDVVRYLARAQSDGDIARVLNRLGYRTGADNTWTALRVLSLRRYHGIAAFERTVDRREVLTIAEAAAALGVSAATVRRMIVLGMLPAKQPVLHAPWSILTGGSCARHRPAGCRHDQSWSGTSTNSG